MKKIAFIVIATLVPMLVFAQADLSQIISNGDAIQMILAQLKGGNLVGLGLVGAVVQILMILLRSDLVSKALGQANAQIRFAIVLLLSLVGGVVALMSGGMTIGAALLHSTTLAAFQVFFHQIYTVYIEKKKV